MAPGARKTPNPDGTPKWKQWKWLGWTGGATFILGLLISPVFARVLPFGWDGQVAAFILQADRWHAGQALMKSDDPAGWATLAAEVSLVEPNHAALTACREAAVKTKKTQTCAIVVRAP